MKFLFSLALFSIAMYAQNPPDARIITFSRADSAHCRVIQAGGKPLLETSYNGTTVAIGLPENRGNGEFSVFVSIAQVDRGATRVVPKDFSAVFNDAGHTRFTFFDKASEVKSHAPDQASGAGISATTNEIDRSMVRGGPPQGTAAGLSPSETLKGDNVPGNQVPPGVAPPPSPVFLEPAKVKQGTRVAGLVFFRKPKGSKLEIHPSDMFDEIDIPVNGIVYRF